MAEKGKIDLIMWTYNSAKLLPTVLARINEVIPAEAVNKKIVSDDHSTDQTAKIARDVAPGTKQWPS